MRRRSFFAAALGGLAGIFGAAGAPPAVYRWYRLGSGAVGGAVRVAARPVALAGPMRFENVGVDWDGTIRPVAEVDCRRDGGA